MQVPASVDQALASPGRPLEPALRQDMEQRLGHDFSQVRVHSDAAAEQSAREVDANAYTVGRNIVFGASRFTPGTQEGQRLIAHELTHVVQQAGSSANRFGQSDGKQELYPISRSYMAPAALLTGRISCVSITSDAWVQRSPNEATLGASGSTSETIVLYHYGNLEGVESFKSHPGYPRLTDCDIATSQAEAAKYTGIPVNENLRYKYELKIDRAYFEKNFINTGTRGAYSEFGTKQPIPVKYFRKVFTLTPTPMTPAAQIVSGAVTVPQRGLVTPSGGGPSRPVTTVSGEITVPQPKGGFRAGLRAGLSAGSIAAEIPGVVLFFADRAAAAEAIRRIQVKFTKEGFAKGVAAGVAEWSEEQVASNLKNRVTPFRVRGLEDPGGLLGYNRILQLAEAYENYAVDLGYQFSSSKTLKWKGDMRAKGLAVLSKRGYHFGEEQSSAPAVKRVYLGNVIVEEELDPAESGPEPKPRYLFEYGFIDKLAWVLRPITNPIIEKAIEKGDEKRRAQQEAELKKMKRESGAVGMKF